MGWTGTYREPGLTNAQYFQQRFYPNGESLILPGHGTVGGVFYAAVKSVSPSNHAPPGEVWALIILTRWERGDFNFAYKELCETMGVGDYDAPASVLDKLSPTDNECANVWRARCRENAERKSRLRKALKGLQAGDEIVLAEPLRFTDGLERDTFAVEFSRDRAGRRRTVLTDGGFTRFRIPRWRTRVAAVVRGGERIEVMSPSR